jgi:predicted GNAT family acetyltransferase
MRQRVFELRQVNHPKYPAGQLRLATAVATDLVAHWIQAFHAESLEPIDTTTAQEMAKGHIREGNIYIWDEGGTLLSMAAKLRPTVHGMTISLVYTPPELRQRGYASACVAALSQQLLDEGWQFCTLFTDLANPTSNSIYQKIGYQPVGDFNDYILRQL